MTVHLAYDAHVARLDDLHREAAQRRRARALAQPRARLRGLFGIRHRRAVASGQPRSAQECA
jgi:hypothetical protein